MDSIRAVSLHEADETFGVRSLFHLGGPDDTGEVLVLPGDSAALERLPLDFSHLDAWSGLTKTHPGMYRGLVVDGDLTVTDWITNWEWDFGPFLLVRGDVRAKNLATAGSEVLIEGDLEVEQTVAGIYNHGHTVVRGDTRAEVVLTQEHLTEFRGGLEARLGIAGNFLRVADPARVRVGAWSGCVRDLRGELVPDLGSRSTRALRALDPDFRDLDSRAILKAMESGRSLLLHSPGPARPLPAPPRTPADGIRDALRLAGCREHDRWDDGFVVDRDRPPFEVYFCEADEPDEPGTPGAPDPLDPGMELTRYAAALTAAGYEVTADPHDEDVLEVGGRAGSD
ncbi:hypothetical protein [Streptomyces graminilatus]|uniref:hypothetical protein n=1 Tax=Streptomyces graminilatus TaxID=1464070 RepID=UPI0006E2271F|nr:hypothetical protein [Streptomyces graminilatus]